MRVPIGCAVAHARRPVPLDDDPAGLGVRHHVQIGPAARRAQIGDGGAAAPSVPDRQLKIGNAGVRRTVVIGILGYALLYARLIESLVQPIPVGDVDDADGPSRPPVGGVAAEPVLEAFEVGQHVVVAPTGTSRIAPAVVLLRVAPHEHHAVDAARTAQNLAARPIDPLPLQFRLGLRRKRPDVLAAGDQLADAERNAQPAVLVLASRFEQQHLVPPAGGEAFHQRGPGRARPDHDVVELAFRHRDACRGDGMIGESRP